MAFEFLCPPALIYLIFSLTQIVIDSVNGLYNTAIIKIWITFIFTILLNYLCKLGLGIISWIIVFIPFVLMTVIVAMLLLMFGLDPTTGKLNIHDSNSKKENKNESKTNKNTSLGIDMRDRSKKENSILANSLLSYTDENENKSSCRNNNETDTTLTTSYTMSSTHLDINMFKLTVYEMSNLLSNLGEQEIAVYFKTQALKCAYETPDLSNEENKNKLVSCYRKIYNKIDELPEERRERVKNAMDSFIENIKIN